MWDTVISVALAIVTIAMAYLGVHVTLHPTESAVARRWYKIGFFGCALLAVGLVIAQGLRASKAQRDYLTRIDSLSATVQQERHATETVQTEVHDAKEQTKVLSTDMKSEVARREQAERDLAVIVNNSSRSVREGVKQDIQKFPVRIETSQEPPNLGGGRCIQNTIDSDRPDAPFALIVTVQTDRAVSPLAMEIVFDGPIVFHTLRILQAGAFLTGGQVPGTQRDDNVLFRINSPPITPQSPVLVTVYSKKPVRLKACNFSPF